MEVDKILTYLLLAALLACIGGVIYIIVTPQKGEKFTEFYILGPKGKAAGYPTDLVEGENGEVIIGVVNHEWRRENYRVVLELENRVIGEIGRIPLDHGENWLRSTSFSPNVTGENLKLEFLLYREENDEVYRELHLFLDVENIS